MVKRRLVTLHSERGVTRSRFFGENVVGSRPLAALGGVGVPVGDDVGADKMECGRLPADFGVFGHFLSYCYPGAADLDSGFSSRTVGTATKGETKHAGGETKWRTKTQTCYGAKIHTGTKTEREMERGDKRRT